MDRTGERIRARRMDAGVSQRELAERVEISASYLNLIEHAKRPVGGQLLRRLAQALDIDLRLLADPEDRGLLERVRGAVEALPEVEVETARLEDLVARYPGAAGLIAAQAARIAALEDRLRRLSDRITYDPDLAAALHGVISAVTGIQSAAGILTEAGNLDADWQSRFQRNIFEDANRLTETSRALVSYLDAPTEADRPLPGPIEARNAELARTGFHRAHLEPGPDGTVPAAPARGPDEPGLAALLAAFDRTYAEDARALPMDAVVEAGRDLDWDPLRLAETFGAPLGRVLRRLAVLPPEAGAPTHGLLAADASGAILLSKPLPTFVPGPQAGCPLWPLYTALGQPGRPVVARMGLPGQASQQLQCHAIAEARPHPQGGHLPPLVEALMLVRAHPADPAVPAVPAGIACRVCARTNCPARREPATVQGG